MLATVPAISAEPVAAHRGDMTSRYTSPSGGAPFVDRGEPQFLLPEASTQFGTVFGGASVTHLGLLGLLFLVLWLRPPLAVGTGPIPPILDSTPLTFVPTLEAPGGGGGGGGDRSPRPPRTSPELAVRPAEAIVPTPTPDPEPLIDEPAAIVPALPPNNLPPAMVETGPPTIGDLGPGNVLGAGIGNNGGIGNDGKGGSGPRDGPGVGPGPDVGPGGGRVTTPPSLIERVRPSYTPEAMMRKVRGEVRLACVVLETGAMGQCDVVQSIDGNAFGLDTEALRAASKWRFKPGMSGNRPVPARVNIVLEFNMR